MSDEPVIKYFTPFHNKTVIYVPDCIKVPEYIIKESAILEAGRGKLMTIYNKHLDAIKIPATCEDCINTLGTKYSVIIADATNAKRYTSPDGKDHTYYDCSVGVIRNPIAIKKCEDIEASAYNVTEYEF